MEALFQKVRAACSSQLWSKAVEIARKELVSGMGSKGQEIHLRVSQSPGGLSSEVTLTLDDLDWLCSCGSDDDPCFHVAAGVIALKRAHEKGEKLPQSKQVGGKITYAFVEIACDSQEPELKLRRSLVYPDGRVTPLVTKIAAMVAGRVPNPGISATPEDVEIDLQLIQLPQMVYEENETKNRSLSRELLSGPTPYPTVVQQKAIISLLKALERLDGVTLGDQLIAINPKPVSLEVMVSDEGVGVLVKGRQDRDIIKRYGNFLALCHSGVRPSWIPQIHLQLRDLLRSGKFYGPRDFPELVSEVLPPLKEVLPLTILSQKLPGVTYGEPFLDLVITRDPQDPLAVISEVKILYKTPGDGVIAAIENGRMVPLNPKIPVPTRDHAQELVLKDQAFRKFGQEIGQKIHHRGQDAIGLINKRPLSQISSSVHEMDNLNDFKLYGALVPEIEIRDRGISIGFLTGSTGSKGSVMDSQGNQIDQSILGPRRRAADPMDVFQAYQRGESLVPLLDGGWAEIPRNWLARYADQLAGFLSQRELLAPKKESRISERESKSRSSSSPTMILEIPREGSGEGEIATLGDLGNLVTELGYTPSPAMVKAQGEIATLFSPPSRTLPADLKAHLRPYQEEGYLWLSQIRQLKLGALLCDEMGLGKTLQAIASMEGQTLIIAPTSVMPNWAEEIRKFRPQVKIHIYHGPGRTLNEAIKTNPSGSAPQRTSSLEDTLPEVTLTTFGTLRTDLHKLTGVLWDSIIVDEGQTIKNPQSQITQAVHSLRGRFRLLLTGTPVENRLEDLWSQMHFANPNLLGSLTEFRQNFSQNLKKTFQEDATQGAPLSPLGQDLWKRLHERLRPYLKRRLKSEVAPDLPPKTETIRYVELTAEERTRYEALRLATREDLLAKIGLGGQAMAALEGLLRLRQAACHGRLLPGFINDQEGAHPYPFSSKLAVLVELLQESIENGHKILVFSQWTSFLKLIATALEFHQISYLTLTGETDDRLQVINLFQDPNGPKTLLISLKAGGVGLNLTAADHVIFVDPWWNPAVEDQAIDRTHRIGQDKPILIQRLVALQTVEEKILALKEIKKNIAAATLDRPELSQPLETGNLGSSISSEEILALLD